MALWILDYLCLILAEPGGKMSDVLVIRRRVIVNVALKIVFIDIYHYYLLFMFPGTEYISSCKYCRWSIIGCWGTIIVQCPFIVSSHKIGINWIKSHLFILLLLSFASIMQYFCERGMQSDLLIHSTDSQSRPIVMIIIFTHVISPSPIFKISQIEIKVNRYWLLLVGLADGIIDGTCRLYYCLWYAICLKLPYTLISFLKNFLPYEEVKETRQDPLDHDQ